MASTSVPLLTASTTLAPRPPAPAQPPARMGSTAPSVPGAAPGLPTRPTAPALAQPALDALQIAWRRAEAAAELAAGDPASVLRARGILLRGDQRVEPGIVTPAEHHDRARLRSTGRLDRQRACADREDAE